MDEYNTSESVEGEQPAINEVTHKTYRANGLNYKIAKLTMCKTQS
jgi:hypothetical protein